MRFAILLSAVALLSAQSTAPKTKASDYPLHVQLGTVTLAAEYLVRSLPTPSGTLVATDYLVVETAFFGPSMSRLQMSPANFTLRINGRGTPLSTELPGMVAASIKFPSQHPGLTAAGSVGMNDGTVTVGPRPPPSQFPGDGNERVPANQPVTIIQKEQEDSIEARVQGASLPEGEKSLPRSGLIYFPYRGKTKSIHSLELIYEGAMGKATLKLLP
ncbi:MAG: hypothetical protein ABSF22_09100 [Bryobacteraceae bacterium]|jgi:hypothetical protein